jgi:hypothetical protein
MKASILAALLALVLPASATASTQYYIPPGNSSGNEYVESVPTAGGSAPALAIHHGGSGGSGSRGSGSGGAISPATRAALVRQGNDGAQTAAFVEATSPSAGFASSTPASTSGHTPRSASSPQTGVKGTRGGGSRGGAAGTGAAVGAARVGASSAATSVARSIIGVGGQGAIGLLPVALAAIVVVMVGIVLWRRRRAA